MSKNKHKHELSSSMPNNRVVDTTHPLDKWDENVAQETAKYLPLKEIAALSRISNLNHQLFQPILDKAKTVHPLLTAVVHGDPDALAVLVQKNPALLFQKGQITDPAGQIFYDVSPYQLMIFLCDDDMKNQIMSLMTNMTKEMTRLRQEQYAEIDSGGADLIKIDRDPELIAFEDVNRFITNYTIDNQATPVTFPLLENLDGIIFYKNATTGFEYFFYVNQKTQTVELIEPEAHSQHEQTDLDDLKISFRAMENNSSRRSNNAEHALIAATMQHTLSRKGIHYERGDARYCDNRMSFRLVAAYRKCVRLQQGVDGLSVEDWRHGVGQAQRDVMWLLQRICEEDRLFYPLPDFKASPFRRGFSVDNEQVRESLFRAPHLDPRLGSDFAISKGAAGASAHVGHLWYWWMDIAFDLIAVCRLIEDAKANVVEFTPDLDSIERNAASNYQRRNS